MSQKPIIGYSIRPIYPAEPGMMQTACLSTCAVTGKLISSMGGGSVAITPEVYERLMSPEGQAFFSDLVENHDSGGTTAL